VGSTPTGFRHFFPIGMAGSKRAGDITYYDELGLASNASAAEIRNSFLALARILHPDQQTDPVLKDVADRQMRKLNGIYTVLSDPERRRRYDDLLAEEPPLPVMQPEEDAGSHPWRGRAVWGGAFVVGAGLLLWLWMANTGAPQSAAQASASVPPVSGARLPARGNSSGSDSAEVARLRADLRSLAAQRDAAIQELERLRGGSVAADSVTIASTALPGAAPPAVPSRKGTTLPAITELPPAPARAGPPPATPRPVSRGLPGFWFYVKPPEGQQNQNRSLYPPEYIEAIITEVNGIVQGRYRSRFRITDRAISPEVNFSFTGPEGSPSYAWAGPGGARGEITLRLTAENQMLAEWTASDLGTQQGLASGTALLKRRIE
jgi:curved DNA-binding protein CbpA